MAMNRLKELLFFVALPSNPSVVPYQFTGFTEEMTLVQRVWNFYLKLSGVVIMHVMNWYSDSFIRRHLPDSPSVQDMMANISGLLINHNSAWEIPRCEQDHILLPIFVFIYALSD